jgi:hypothetical protein
MDVRYTDLTKRTFFLCRHLAIISVLLWDIVLAFSISDDESVRKAAFNIFVRFSDKFESFPSEDLPGRICRAALGTCGSVEIVAVILKTIRQCENHHGSDNQGQEVRKLSFDVNFSIFSVPTIHTFKSKIKTI